MRYQDLIGRKIRVRYSSNFFTYFIGTVDKSRLVIITEDYEVRNWPRAFGEVVCPTDMHTDFKQPDEIVVIEPNGTHYTIEDWAKLRKFDEVQMGGFFSVDGKPFYRILGGCVHATQPIKISADTLVTTEGRS